MLVGVGLYVRLKIEETPVFRDVLDGAAPVRVPRTRRGCCAVAADPARRRPAHRGVRLLLHVFGIGAGLAVFPILDTKSTTGLIVGFSLLLAVVAIGYGPAAAALPELFETGYRYTAAGLGYNLAGILGGAIPIILAPEILDAWGSFGIGIYLAGIALLSTCCTLALPETKNVDIAAPDRSRELVEV